MTGSVTILGIDPGLAVSQSVRPEPVEGPLIRQQILSAVLLEQDGAEG